VIPLPASLDLTGVWDAEVQENAGGAWTSSGDPQFHASLGKIKDSDLILSNVALVECTDKGYNLNVDVDPQDECKVTLFASCEDEEISQGAKLSVFCEDCEWDNDEYIEVSNLTNG